MSSMPDSQNHNLFICNNNTIDTNFNNNSLVQLSDCKQLSTQGLSLNAFLNGLISNVANNLERPDVWSDVLLDVIENNVFHKNDSMLLEVLNLTISKSQSHLLSSRLFACKMLTKLCIRLDESVVNKQIFPLVQHLCQDFESVIRAHMCRLLFLISRNIGLELTKSQIVPKLLDLSKDREVIVRVSCIESIIDLMSTVDKETVDRIVLPSLIVMFDEAFNANDNSLPLIFLNFGKLCLSLPKDLIAQQEWFLNYYCNIFTINSDSYLLTKQLYDNERVIECRIALAINLPALLHIYGSIDSLVAILDSLCTDVHKTVVKSIASEFYKIVHSFRNPYTTSTHLSKLLCNKSVEISKTLIPFLADIMITIITSTPIEEKELLCELLVNSLIECERTLSENLDWRSHVQFFEVLTRLMQYLPENLIQTNLISILIDRILTARPVPTRIGVSRCVLIIFRDNPILLKTLNIYEWFVTNLCFAKSCYQRMLFLNVCELMSELCDKSILVSYILEPLLHLRKDKVPNIRLHMCQTFKLFHPLLTVPKIGQRIDKLKQFFFLMLKNEKDSDVIHSINSLIDSFQWRLELNTFEVEE